MKSVIIVGLLVVCGMFYFISCKEELIDYTRRERTLMQGDWIATDVLLNGTSVWKQFDDCVKDNFYNFSIGNEVLRNEGATKCDSNHNQMETMYWKLIEGDTRMVFDGDTFMVLELNSDSFVLESSIDNNTTLKHYKIK